MSDEQLIRAFYACDSAALDTLADRYHLLLARVVFLVMWARTGSRVQALREWDIDDRVQNVWAEVYNGKFRIGQVWEPNKGSVLNWLIDLAAREMDRHLRYR